MTFKQRTFLFGEDCATAFINFGKIPQRFSIGLLKPTEESNYQEYEDIIYFRYEELD